MGVSMSGTIGNSILETRRKNRVLKKSRTACQGLCPLLHEIQGRVPDAHPWLVRWKLLCAGHINPLHLLSDDAFLPNLVKAGAAAAYMMASVCV